MEQYLQYNDPLNIVYRKGTPDDPYKDRTDSLPVINNQITLLEIPSEFHRVKIAGFTEINNDIYQKRNEILPHEFLVNYSNGNIQFHPSNDGRTLLCDYKGRGIILYPASRIYAMVSRNPDVTTTLQEIIDEALIKIGQAEIAVNNVNEAIRNAEIATQNANVATDNAHRAADAADIATMKALDAYDTTRLVFKPYVMEYEDIATTFPNPEIGWTTQAYRTGVRYRYNGAEWVPIDLFGGAIPKANEFIDGLLSKEDFSRLEHIDETTYDRRVVVLVLPSISSTGKQGIIVRFPFNGKLIDVKGICSTVGTTDTEFSIEKSNGDISTWIPMLSRNLLIREHENFDDGGTEILVDTVNAGDLFRLDVIQQGIFIQNITIEMTIDTVKN